MITLDNPQPGIFVYDWREQVTMEEAEAIVDQLAEQHSPGQPYVAIIDLTHAKTLPRDINHMRRNVRREIDLGLQGYVLVNAPRFVDMFIKPLHTLTKVRYVVASDVPEAILIAEQWLPAHSAD